MSLGNLAGVQSETGNRDGALATSCDAVELYRKLAQANPAAYTPDLARSLYVLTMALAATDDSLKAKEAAREAVQLLEPFAAASHAAFGGLLQAATSLRDRLSG